MASPSHPSATRDRSPGDDPRLVAVRDAVAALRVAVAGLPDPSHGPDRAVPSRSRLAPGGVVLATDDGRGIARAVAADLAALGHPVVRVRHGVGSPGVEGVNLASPAAVAALLERARERGRVAAILHASPLRDSDSEARMDEARAFALLARAGADDLRGAASAGGACLVLAVGRDDPAIAEDRFARWADASSGGLAGVRLRRLELDPGGEVEVLAAEVVQAVLDGRDPAERRAEAAHAPRAQAGPEARTPCEALLLGAPDRASWIALAAALIDWLEESRGVRLADLVGTLHHGQPDYPFRVGLVADSASALVDRLKYAIARLVRSGCLRIHHPGGVYFTDPEHGHARAARHGARRNSGSGRFDPRPARLGAMRRPEEGAAPVPIPSGWAWLSHEVAWRFGHGRAVPLGLFRDGPPFRRLDLSRPHLAGEEPAAGRRVEGGAPDPLREAVRLLDESIALQHRLATLWLDAPDP